MGREGKNKKCIPVARNTLFPVRCWRKPLLFRGWRRSASAYPLRFDALFLCQVLRFTRRSTMLITLGRNFQRLPFSISRSFLSTVRVVFCRNGCGCGA